MNSNFNFKTLPPFDAAKFAPGNVPAFAGISGGRTSGLMAALLREDVTLLFENTGREHESTLEFLNELDLRLGKRIIWLEYRKPTVKGDRPKNARFAVVDFKTANRDGQPFIDFMETMSEYRLLQKNKPPVSPWARQRICTAEMKHKVGNRFIASNGIDAFTSFIGLRSDEPERVNGIKNAETTKKDYRCPLSDVNFDKKIVTEFWNTQNFDLGLEDYQGNCDGCFLKDQADLSRSLGEMKDPYFWFFLEETYPSFGGVNFFGYRKLMNEYKLRKSLENCLEIAKITGSEPILPDRPEQMNAKRFLNVVRQEASRFKNGATKFSCSCEKSFVNADLNEEGD